MILFLASWEARKGPGMGETWGHFCHMPRPCLGQPWMMGWEGNELVGHSRLCEARTSDASWAPVSSAWSIQSLEQWFTEIPSCKEIKLFLGLEGQTQASQWPGLEGKAL